VIAVDDPPEVNSPIKGIVLQEDAKALVKDISTVFIDKDSDNASIDIHLMDNTNELLCDAHVTGHTLIIHLKDNEYGESQLTLVANSDGQHITHAFQLRVNPVNDAPELNAIYPELESITEDDIHHLGQPVYKGETYH